jgi:hypothetical protein
MVQFFQFSSFGLLSKYYYSMIQGLWSGYDHNAYGLLEVLCFISKGQFFVIRIEHKLDFWVLTYPIFADPKLDAEVRYSKSLLSFFKFHKMYVKTRCSKRTFHREKLKNWDFFLGYQLKRVTISTKKNDTF